MSASAVLEDPAVQVVPGERAATEVRVKNTGTIVEEFTLTVVGEAGAWSTVEPQSISLLPDAVGVVTITIAPPRDHTVVAGPRVVAVRVEPRENPEGVVVEEFELDVAAFSDLDGELVPRTISARRWGSTRLAIDNRGNSSATVHLRAQDPDEALRFELSPPVLTVAPGGATFAGVRVRAKDRPFKGPRTTVAYTVRGEPDVGDVVHMDGAVQIIPRIPQWAPRVALAALLALLALLGLWFAVLKPTLESTARQAVARDVAAAEESAALADENAGTANLAAEEAAGAAETAQGAADTAQGAPAADGGAGAEEGAGGDAAGGAAGGGAGDASAAAAAAAAGRPPIAGDPFSFRLQVLGPPGTTRATTFAVDEDEVLSLTDVVLQNPQGDRGILRVGRGDVVLLESRLENFRDLDYHFLAPIVYTDADQLVLTVACENDPGVACSASGYFAGYLAVPPPAAPPPTQ